MLYATQPRTGANTKKMAILPSMPAKFPTTCSAASACSGIAINDAADKPVKPATIPLFFAFFFCISSSWFKPGPKMLYATQPRTGANTKKMAILPSIPAKLLTTSSDCVVEANDDCAKPSAPDVVATAAPTFAASLETFVSEDCTYL